jgi:polysaccharide export outer membrane protein
MSSWAPELMEWKAGMQNLRQPRTDRVRGMVKEVTGGLLVAWMLAGGMPTLAQVPAAKPSPELKTNPMVALRDFEPSANEEYRLGRGDEISVDFGGRLELNGKHVIGPDGKITLPVAGSILVADKTRQEAADAISAAMNTYYSRLSVTVGVDKYTSNQVLLLGAVEHPGVQTFDRPPTLLEVVTRGGASGNTRNGFTSNGTSYNMEHNLQPAILGVPERCAIYRGSDKVMWVDLKALLDSGSPLADLRLKRDDIVYVPSPAERYISVMGQVLHPGALQLDSTSTLPKLLALAGGLTPEAGKNPNIQIIQTANGKTRLISWKQLLQPTVLDLTLQSGDIIYVPESGFNQAAYVFQKVSPLITLFTGSALISH